MEIPIVDIFAGPGGLGEGFAGYKDPETKERVFKIALSIEKERFAHQTLTLRSFFRQFSKNQVPSDYYEFVKGTISLEELYNLWPNEAEKAKNESWKAQLGEDSNAVPNKLVDEKIKKALNGEKNWLLIGGPPCQAYSVVGRARRQEKTLDEEKDARVGLYKQYLRILAVHNPAVFVMENVKGLLSARTKASPVFSNILNDLYDPVSAYLSEDGINGSSLNCPGYKIYSLVSEPEDFDVNDNPVFKQKDFIIHAENHGIPQARHRVILIGVRKDLDILPDILPEEKEAPVKDVLEGLPEIRSGISKGEDGDKNWMRALKRILQKEVLSNVDQDVKEEIKKQLRETNVPQNGTGREYVLDNAISINHNRFDWFLNDDLGGALNHSSRSHMESDLLRYFFISCFGKVKGRSPKLEDFPPDLLPAHKNVQAGIDERKFADRFTVQLWNKPSKTITSHISKDGHYYIHPDPKQCRSFTVREAARIQTFPDDYFFYGPRTSQFHQVGNAVPPLLANKIASIVFKMLQTIKGESKKSKEEKLVLNE